MRRTTIGCLVSLALSLFSALCLADAQQVVFLMRHGEQASGANGDAPLAEAGQRTRMGVSAQCQRGMGSDTVHQKDVITQPFRLHQRGLSVVTEIAARPVHHVMRQRGSGCAPGWATRRHRPVPGKAS